jgi:biopolymer transport protein ExbD
MLDKRGSMDLPELWGRVDSPAAHGVRAQFVFATLLAVLAPLPLISHPVPTHAVRFDFGQAPANAVRYHPLEIEPQGTMRIDGDEVDMAKLRRRLEVISMTSGDWVDFRPDAHARYEMVLEALLLTKRAGLGRVRFDNSLFRSAMD